MSQKLQDSPHRLGVAFATVVLFVGLAVAITDMVRGAKPTDVAQVVAYTAGIAALCYIVVRVVGWIFSELLSTTREHRTRRP
jgi:NADH:ubiquinone oxidoreductase subunit 6 (subunit J)